MKPSIGASMPSSESYEVPSVGKGKKSRSSWSACAVRLLSGERAQEIYIPAFFWTRRLAVSCHVLPRLADMSPLNGRSSFQAVNTAAVFGSVHFWAPFMRSMWYL